MSKGGGATTVSDVVRYAEHLRALAMAIMNPDPNNPYHVPYARPVYPTTAAVRKMCQRMGEREVSELPLGASVDEIEAARARGPAVALNVLAARVAQVEREFKEEERDAQQSRKKLWRVQRREARDREAMRLGLSPGQRIDRALADLSTVPAPPGTGFDARVAGSKEEDPVPRFPGDPMAVARGVVRDAVRRVEDEADSAKRRRLELEPEDDPSRIGKAA